MNRLTNQQRFWVALTLFGMFFGAGNLIFPVHIGQLAGNYAFFAVLGFLITAAGIPILSVAAIGSTHSDSLHTLANRVGEKYSYIFTVVLYLTLGPFFAIPRCASTSFTVGIAPLLPEGSHEKLALFLFSLLFLGVVLFCSLRPGQIVVWIGKIINPIFLFFLFVLLITVFVKSDTVLSDIAPAAEYASTPVLSSAIWGYQTMDAIAGLAFGIVVVNTIRNMGVTSDKAVAKEILYAGIIAGVLMGVIYALVIFMGAESRGLFEVSENGGIALAQIAQHFVGKYGALVLAAIIIFACLKTSIGLVTSCAEAFAQMFPNSLKYRTWAVIFAGFSFLVSNVGLSKIIEYAIPVLMFIYPLTITIILLALMENFFGRAREVYITVTAFTGVAAVLDFLNALPAGTKDHWGLGPFLESVGHVLPLFHAGFGWLVPALVGFVIGYVMYQIRSHQIA